MGVVFVWWHKLSEIKSNFTVARLSVCETLNAYNVLYHVAHTPRHMLQTDRIYLNCCITLWTSWQRIAECTKTTGDRFDGEYAGWRNWESIRNWKLRYDEEWRNWYGRVVAAAHSAHGERDKNTHTRQLAQTIPLAILSYTVRFSIITFLLVLYGRRLEMENGDADGIFFALSSHVIDRAMPDDCYMCARHMWTRNLHFFGQRLGERGGTSRRQSIRVDFIVVGRRPINRTYWISSTKWNANRYDGTRFSCVSVSIYQTTLCVWRLNRRRTCWIAFIPFIHHLP